MMFDDDQIALRDVARRFARERLRPDYQKRESQPGICLLYTSPSPRDS